MNISFVSNVFINGERSDTYQTLKSDCTYKQQYEYKMTHFDVFYSLK